MRQTDHENPNYRYTVWAGNPKGYAQDSFLCVYEVFPSERGALHHQCQRRRGHGPRALYCRQHAKLIGVWARDDD